MQNILRKCWVASVKSGAKILDITDIRSSYQPLARFVHFPDNDMNVCHEPLPPKLDKCGRPVVKKKKKTPLTVTVLGCNCLVGSTLAALLKTNLDIDRIKMYDQQEICGTALDISHISTSVKVTSYSGHEHLPEAIEGAHLIAICGGCQTDPCLLQQEVFVQNAGYVRNLATTCAEFNPNAFVAVVSEPANFLVPLIHEEYLKAGYENGRRLAGIVNLYAMAANTIVGTYAKMDKSQVDCPIIGGSCPKTIVPILSHLKMPLTGFNAQKVSEEIAFYPYKVLQLKLKDCDGPCYAISAYAANKFIGSVIRGMRGATKGNKQYAFIKQFGKLERLMSFMTTLVEFGKEGIRCSSFPKLNDLERHLLSESYRTLRNQINEGESFINGRVYTRAIMKKSCRDTCNLVVEEDEEMVRKRMKSAEKVEVVCPGDADKKKMKKRSKIKINKGDSIVGKRIEDIVMDETYIEKRRSPCAEIEMDKKEKCPKKRTK